MTDQHNGSQGIILQLPLAELLDRDASNEKAPTPANFMPYIQAELDLAILELESILPKLSQTLASQIGNVTADVKQTLQERGDEYGEDVLFLTGEKGLILMATWKVLRMLWSVDTGKEQSRRRDGWRDLTGYALLAQAMEDFLAEKEAESAKDAT